MCIDKRRPASLQELVDSSAALLSRTFSRGPRIGWRHRLLDFLAPVLSMRLCQFHNSDRYARRFLPTFIEMLDSGPLDQLVIGHTHVSGTRRWPGPGGVPVEVISTGAWLVNASPLAVVQEGDAPAALYRLTQHADGAWKLGRPETRRKVF